MDAAGDTKAVGPGGPPTPLLDLVIVQISPGEGSAHDALLAGLSRERVFENYDIARGGLMPIGLLFMAAAPYLAARFRGNRALSF